MVDYDAAAKAMQDENADPAFLARIAYENPEFGPNVAAHPRAYPGLLAWIAQFGTAEARQIVEQRGDLPQGASASVMTPAQGVSSESDISESRQPLSRMERAARSEPVQQAIANAAAEFDRPAAQPSHGFTAQQATDPATDPMTQHNIAEYAPELRVYLARNPNIYPELLTWLGTLNDPQINAAIAARR